MAKGKAKQSSVQSLGGSNLRLIMIKTNRSTLCMVYTWYVPRTRKRFGDRAFAVAAPRVWNSLPTDIKLHRSTTTSFKRRLKTVLFNRGFAEYM